MANVIMKLFNPHQRRLFREGWAPLVQASGSDLLRQKLKWIAEDLSLFFFNNPTSLVPCLPQEVMGNGTFKPVLT